MSEPDVAYAKEYSAKSPNGRTILKVSVGENISYQVEAESNKIIEPSMIALTLSDGTILGLNPTIKNVSNKTVNTTISSTLYKKSIVADRYNLLVLNFRESFSVEFRVYDDGISYRFVTSLPGKVTVKEEKTEFNFGGDHYAWIQYVNRWGKGDKYYTTFEKISHCRKWQEAIL